MSAATIRNAVAEAGRGRDQAEHQQRRRQERQEHARRGRTPRCRRAIERSGGSSARSSGSGGRAGRRSGAPGSSLAGASAEPIGRASAAGPGSNRSSIGASSALAVAQPPDTAGITWTIASVGHGRRERRSLARDEDVDVRPDRRARRPRAGSGSRAPGRRGRRSPRPRSRRAPRCGAARPGRARRASAAGGRPAIGRQPTTAASTDQIDGRLSAIRRHVRPSSRLPYSWPVLVPK